MPSWDDTLLTSLYSLESRPLLLMLILLFSQEPVMVSVWTIPTAVTLALQALRETWGFCAGKRNGTRIRTPA